VLDGDDYWTSTEKLAKQVAYLDANPGCVICYHDVQFVSDDPSVAPSVSETPHPGTSTIDDLLQGNYIFSCSIMFRRSALPVFPDWFADAGIGDYPLLIMLAKSGWIGHLDEVLGVYRVHAGSSWEGSDLVGRLRTTVDALEALGPDLSAEQQQQAARYSASILRIAAEKLRARGDYGRANDFLGRAGSLLKNAGVSW
jgi:hypothetical protein